MLTTNLQTIQSTPNRSLFICTNGHITLEQKSGSGD